MVDAERDDEFGVLREPVVVNEWEAEFSPVSRVKLDAKVGRALADLRLVSVSPLLKAAAIIPRYIWVMDAQCDIWIAYEELAPINSSIIPGTPRRLGEHIQEKLGHPTLVKGSAARIAGELFLDETETKELVWILNVQSGRYCRHNAPSTQHQQSILKLFRMLVEDGVRLDDEL